MLKIKGIIKRISIRDKLIIFMTVIVIAISLFNLYFYNSAYSFTDEYNKLLKDYIDVNSLSMKLIQSRESIAKYSSLDSEFTGNKSELENYYYNKDQMNRLLGVICNSSNSQDSYLLSNAIRNSIETYEEKAARIIEMKPGSEEMYLGYLKIRNDSTYIEDYIKQLLDVKLSEGEWYQQQLTGHVERIRVINLAGVFVILLFSLVYIIALSNSITVPLKKLTQFARNISHGNFDNSELRLDSSEDINTLTGTLNKMSKNIQKIINMERQLHEEEIKSVRVSKELNEARFLALQSQINPHFLFNTLNAIARFAMFENAGKTKGLIESLSSIFRYNLRGTDKEVPLTEELKMIEEYAAIQKARFGDRLQFDAVLRADISHVHIPRFIIQPLVENAVIHGLEPKESGGKVRIKISENGGCLVVKVIDNGIGIPREQLQQLLDNSSQTSETEGHTTGIGLSNVRDRITLYYGDSRCFHIKSKKNLGTVITLKVLKS